VLNPYQRTALEVEMRSLELMLRGILRSMQSPPENGLLTRVQPVPSYQREQLTRLIPALLAEIEAVVREFALQPQELELGRQISAEMSGAWSDLNEVLVAKLKRYGRVDPRLRRTLDPHIRNMIRMALEAANPGPGTQHEEA